ncbi:MAG: hypothetical protein ACTSRG_19070 [Candidatus Helarchaeota archaeon]
MNKPYFLYIINSAGICLFSYNFKKDLKLFDIPLFSGFITAVSKFSEELNRQLSNADEIDRIPSIPINKFFEILISYKNGLTGALIVEKKDIDEDMNTYLEEILLEFHVIYKDVLANWNDDVAVFESFKDEIERIFEKMTVFSFQIPELKEEIYDLSFLSQEFNGIVKFIDGKRDIIQISKLTGKSVEEVKNMISKLLWHEAITLSQKVYDDDIFESRRDLFYLIRAEKKDSELQNRSEFQNKNKEFELLKKFDGFKTIYELSEIMFDFSLHNIKYITSYYLTQGNFLEKVELYPQIIKISDDTRSFLPPDSLALSYSLENVCDGDLSLSEISKKIDVPIIRIKKILDLLGTEVTFRKKRKK